MTAPVRRCFIVTAPFAKASEAAQQALAAHNTEETPLFAKDIESKALAKRWG